MRKNPYNLPNHQDEDDFLYAIKDPNEIEMDMRQRENQNEPGSETQRTGNTSQRKEKSFEHNNENDDSEEQDNKTSNNNYDNLGSDYISLF
jgi:hypothetical protein